mmetsp:Transcript_26676/g.22419  ORF Transcript_26676/g.22419 Transcript_26676/m.22419 type:complete len:92 (+) Transcript_26676:190-465(+)
MDNEGQLVCMGEKSSGQLDVPSFMGQYGFAQGTRSASAGCNHSCGIKSNFELQCWGSNWHGQVVIPNKTQLSSKNNNNNHFNSNDPNQLKK